LQPTLAKRGAEADIYLTEWGGRKAVSKVRTPKPYRHRELTPFVHFVDPVNAEIIMEFAEGDNVRDALTPDLCYEMGRYAAMLHASNIIHGDLATSNFIINNKLVLLDFGLSYHSERTEDMATDIRLIKEVFTSAHIAVKKAFPRFVESYAAVAGKKRTDKILENVKEIEQRGRYARVT